MDDLVLIAKVPHGARGQRSGRPARVEFALRNYGELCFLALPRHMVQDGDGAEFYKSSTGFAIQISANGSRKISSKKNNMSATVPLEIRTLIGGAFNGTITVPHTSLANNTFFFSFEDIHAAAQAK